MASPFNIKNIEVSKLDGNNHFTIKLEFARSEETPSNWVEHLLGAHGERSLQTLPGVDKIMNMYEKTTLTIADYANGAEYHPTAEGSRKAQRSGLNDPVSAQENLKGMLGIDDTRQAVTANLLAHCIKNKEISNDIAKSVLTEQLGMKPETATKTLRDADKIIQQEKQASPAR